MTDQGAQHGPRIDEEMRDEVRGLIRGAPVDNRAREDLEPEPLDRMMVPIDPVDDPQHHEVLERSEVARFLRPSALPADATTILALATDEGATDAVLDELRLLPPARSFATVAEIWEALGHETEHRASSADPGAPRSAAPREPEDAAIEREAEREDELEREFENAVDEDDLHEETSAEPGPSPGRDLAVFGLGILRGLLEAADRVLAAIEHRIE